MLVSMYVIRLPCELHCLPCEKDVKPFSCSNDKSEFSLSHVSWRQIAWKGIFCCLAISNKATKASNLALMLWVFKLSILKLYGFLLRLDPVDLECYLVWDDQDFHSSPGCLHMLKHCQPFFILLRENDTEICSDSVVYTAVGIGTVSCWT